ncbi:Integral membrane protein OS=Streptomyces lavendulae subsp. lavendulae OX=58340 GN=SLAV_03615 PE=4 SV=1 [Streptomyces lavendulae subsp. lavendulae]
MDQRVGSLTVWAGRSTVAIGAAHLVYFSLKTRSHWGGWACGALHGRAAIDDPANAASVGGFWSLPGSFAVPLILLGLLVSRMARTGQEPPGYLAWTPAARVLLCTAVLEPSGFPLGIVPVALLLLARRHRGSATRTAPGTAAASG